MPRIIPRKHHEETHQIKVHIIVTCELHSVVGYKLISEYICIVLLLQGLEIIN